ncbi:MAG: methylenetetrahydrofolate--tRNA-(uracil(54)-C(5))-methyltransferase (FADH(2)-oxidizing) TrmFO [Nitrospinae bacterium]|nr:methylenetetrahydrofolate--tRNA-(uracil(54)-C(5))-methyltransferase (FADH(2)-oxidizing) TrmFO [Nitrospinota bacterium]
MRLQETAGRRAFQVAVIGGGLAGPEAAWQLSRILGENGRVDLYEMRPVKSTPAHATAWLGELVCSNSLKSEELSSPTGMLKENLSKAGSLIMEMARKCRVPAGKALAVDRELLGKAVTKAIQSRQNIRLIREEVTDIPEGYDAVIVSTGPLTSNALAERLKELIGGDGLYFYDAIAPIVEADSLDRSMVFEQDRYAEPGAGDYLNIPLNRNEYESFIDSLLSAQTVRFENFEKEYYFEGCLPIEEIASRGREALSFGPMKPVGITNPATGERPYAVIQLRKENAEGNAYNLVGFQTKLTYPEQERIFRTLPGLKEAHFLRFGSLHRNTYINSPRALSAGLTLKNDHRVRLAGQITGVEGYVEAVAMGFLAGAFTAWELLGMDMPPPPHATTLGALLHYITDPARADNFQPTNINFALFPPLEKKTRGRKERRALILERANEEFAGWIETLRQTER